MTLNPNGILYRAMAPYLSADTHLRGLERAYQAEPTPERAQALDAERRRQGVPKLLPAKQQPPLPWSLAAHVIRLQDLIYEHTVRDAPAELYFSPSAYRRMRDQLMANSIQYNTPIFRHEGQ